MLMGPFMCGKLRTSFRTILKELNKDDSHKFSFIFGADRNLKLTAKCWKW